MFIGQVTTCSPFIVDVEEMNFLSLYCLLLPCSDVIGCWLPVSHSSEQLARALFVAIMVLSFFTFYPTARRKEDTMSFGWYAPCEVKLRVRLTPA